MDLRENINELSTIQLQVQTNAIALLLWIVRSIIVLRYIECFRHIIHVSKCNERLADFLLFLFGSLSSKEDTTPLLQIN